MLGSGDMVGWRILQKEWVFASSLEPKNFYSMKVTLNKAKELVEVEQLMEKMLLKVNM